MKYLRQIYHKTNVGLEYRSPELAALTDDVTSHHWL